MTDLHYVEVFFSFQAELITYIQTYMGCYFAEIINSISLCEKLIVSAWVQKLTTPQTLGLRLLESLLPIPRIVHLSLDPLKIPQGAPGF